ncbi:MAG: M20/M25/M40 family metallo-hydrolase [Pseudomonadota bacterium]
MTCGDAGGIGRVWRFCTAVAGAIVLAGCGPTAVRTVADGVPEASPQVKHVRALAQHVDVNRALRHIERHRYTGLSELIELTQIPAPPFGEAARGERYAAMLSQTGFGDVKIDEVGNVVARRAGSVGARTVAVLAHLDTVFPADTDVTVHVDGSRYTAPGVGDNTRGMVLLLELARAVVATDMVFEDNVWLVGNVGEEGLGDLRGVRHLFRDGATPIDSLIAIDGGDTRRIVTEAVGSNRFRVMFSGAGGHSWGDFGDASPLHALGSAVDLLHERGRRVTDRGPRSTFNVGRISGGTSVNSIAFAAWMEVDLRSADPGKLDELTRMFEQSMRDALIRHNNDRSDGTALALSIEPIGQRPAGRTAVDQPLVQQAWAALSYLGLEPETVASSTDANIPMSLGIPAITLSRGGVSGRAHSLEEFWIDRDTHIATQAVLLTLLANAGLGASGT